MPEEVLSPAALDRLREWGGDKLVHQMIRLFLENAHERRRQVAAGLGGDLDLEVVERAAHSLKSGAANVGAMKVSAVATALEDAAEAGDEARCAELAVELDATLDEAEPLLRRIMNGSEG